MAQLKRMLVNGPDEIRKQLVQSQVYERIRRRYVSFMVDLRSRRRLVINDSVTVLFENRETILAQLHELMHLEGGWKGDSIEQWLCDYRPLMVLPGELAATVLVDDDDPGYAHAMTAGLNEGTVLSLCVDGEAIPAVARPASIPGEVVHFVRFSVPRAAAPALGPEMAPLWLKLHLGQDTCVVPVPDELRKQLLSDLRGPGSAPSQLARLVDEERWALSDQVCSRGN